MYRNYITDKERLEKLELLHKKKYELKALLDKQKEKTPFVVEFAGMPRTGKTVTTERVFEFFKMADYKVLRTKEPAQIVKEKYDTKSLSGVEFNDKTLEISKEQLDYCKLQKPDIILQDRGVFDNYIWYQMMYERGQISYDTYLKKIKDMNDVVEDNDLLFLMTAKPEIIIQRDYLDQIFLEPRKKTTVEGVSQLKQGMFNLYNKMKVEGVVLLDTSYIDETETAINISDTIIDGMRLKLKNKNM